MIEPEDYKFPHKQEPAKPKPQADPATLDYLKALPWQPFDVEW